MKAILIGILASFFFAVTFVVNKLMSDAGGSWLWSASLRYLFMLPILLILVFARKRQRALWSEMRQHPWQWGWWSFVGFGLFYAPLCFSAAYSPAWLVAGTWQFTIIAGSLVVPLFRERRLTPQGVIYVRRRIPMKGMGMSLIILVGIAAMEWSQSTRVPLSSFLLGTLPILLATFAYPLGNRKMMELCEGRLDAYQRTLGMTIASLPLWLILAIYETCTDGLPSVNQTLQSVVVAVFSGVIATVLFFTATDMAKGNVQQLAVVEATQSGEVVFTIVGERLLIPGTSISVGGFVRLALVVLGMILHSLRSSRTKSSPHEKTIEISS
ncbi:hypothetical protein AAC03nite_09710 [Alicyclobacillus acidoterrestris]|nr:hypothetical protein AAC03nite_09710 [Alicyclobacillus acidoterrestris]